MGVSGVSTDSQRSSQQQALYFSKFEKYLAVMIVVVDCFVRACISGGAKRIVVSHPFPQRKSAKWALLVAEKRVKYGSGRIERRKASSRA
jgi:hypothetical protein